jgi:nitroreductase
MNETIKTILSRRSVRSYSSEQIKNEELDLILKAGLYAPSAHNQQSWHFTVIQDKEVIDNLNKASKEAMLKQEYEYLRKFAEDETFNLFYNAPTVIFVAGEKANLAPHIDCAAAIQNMLIAAESLNIGTCWIGLVTPLFKSERAQEFANLFGISESYELYFVVAVGYKAKENPQLVPRRENTVNYIKED